MRNIFTKMIGYKSAWWKWGVWAVCIVLGNIGIAYANQFILPPDRWRLAVLFCSIGVLTSLLATVKVDDRVRSMRRACAALELLIGSAVALSLLCHWSITRDDAQVEKLAVESRQLREEAKQIGDKAVENQERLDKSKRGVLDGMAAVDKGQKGLIDSFSRTLGQIQPEDRRGIKPPKFKSSADSLPSQDAAANDANAATNAAIADINSRLKESTEESKGYSSDRKGWMDWLFRATIIEMFGGIVGLMLINFLFHQDKNQNGQPDYQEEINEYERNQGRTEPFQVSPSPSPAGARYTGFVPPAQAVSPQYTPRGDMSPVATVPRAETPTLDPVDSGPKVSSRDSGRLSPEMSPQVSHESHGTATEKDTPDVRMRTVPGDSVPRTKIFDPSETRRAGQSLDNKAVDTDQRTAGKGPLDTVPAVSPAPIAEDTPKPAILDTVPQLPEDRPQVSHEDSAPLSHEDREPAPPAPPKVSQKPAPAPRPKTEKPAPKQAAKAPEPSAKLVREGENWRILGYLVPDLSDQGITYAGKKGRNAINVRPTGKAELKDGSRYICNLSQTFLESIQDLDVPERMQRIKDHILPKAQEKGLTLDAA